MWIVVIFVRVNKQWIFWGNLSACRRFDVSEMLLVDCSIVWLLKCRGTRSTNEQEYMTHDDVIKWKHYPRYWPFVRGIPRSPVNSPHKGQWSGALMFYLICVWINGWVINRKAGDLRRYRAHYDIFVCKSYIDYVVGEVFPWGGNSVIFSVCASTSRTGVQLHEIDIWLYPRSLNEFYGALMFPKINIIMT